MGFVALTFIALMFAGCGGGTSNSSSNPSSNPSNGVTALAITTQPINQAVIVGKTATFSVSCTGTGPTYQWSKNKIAIIGATLSNYTTPVTSASDDGSLMSVVVSNGDGNVTSTSATLTVTAAGGLVLNASPTSLSFGSVTVLTNKTQPVTLTNAGAAKVTISKVTFVGAGFDVTGVPQGTFLAPGQSATLSATFAPAVNGNETGSITVTSDAGTIVIALSGSGAAVGAHAVTLSWVRNASAVGGYNVYVSTVTGTDYVKLTSNPVAGVGYTDSGLQTKQVRYYVVTSVDSTGKESAYSNEASAIIP